MIRARELSGRPVIDVDAAEKLGDIDEILIDTDSSQVAAFRVKNGHGRLGSSDQMILPASAIQSIGPDAVTVRADFGSAYADLADLPKLSELLGRKVVSESGVYRGTIQDILINPDTGRVLGYPLQKGAEGLGRLFGVDSQKIEAYLRAGPDLRIGPDMVVAPESSVVSANADLATELDRPDGHHPHGWGTASPTAAVVDYSAVERSPIDSQPPIMAPGNVPFEPPPAEPTDAEAEAARQRI